MGKRYASPVKAAYLSDIVQQTNRVISLPGLVVMDYTKPLLPDKINGTRQSQMKNLLVLSGLQDQKFAGNLEEV